MLLVSAAQATNWVSPDGKLGFDLPTDGSLTEIKTRAFRTNRHMEAFMDQFTRSAIFFLAALVAGCAAPNERVDVSQVQNLVGDPVHLPVRWNQHSTGDAAVEQKIKALLKKPIGVDNAVQIALLNNRSLQATYEDLGIAQADLVQAGLLKNPNFFASIRFPNQGPASPDAEFSIAADFLDMLLVPLRKQIAADQLAAAQRRVADAVLEMQHQVRVAFYTYQARRQAAMVQKTILDAQLASLELSRQQHKAGNISDLDLASEEANYSSMQLDVSRTEAQAQADREAVTALLGLWGGNASSWQAAEKLPELPEKESPMADLENRAIAQRLDLDAERRQTQLIAQSLGLAEQFRLSGIQIGFDVNRRDPTEHYVTVAGPTLSVELPIFDQKQGEIARLQAEYRQGIDRLTAMAIDIRSQVRTARDRLSAARQTAALYRDHIIPQRQQVTKLSELHYNVMLLGVDRWLMARQAEESAYREYIEAVRDYWIARADLERAVGGRLGGTPDAE
ncbi:MAG TPA: TolC family protein [Tepidisphaeraceae bacterium]|nr:TolC family protein [Tepidisphaeraceae bacterium]